LFQVNTRIFAPATKVCNKELKSKCRQTFRRHYSAKITLNLRAFIALEVGHINVGNCAPFELFVLKI
jgi:hypothetical protein